MIENDTCIEQEDGDESEFKELASSQDSHLSLNALIRTYEKMLKTGRILRGGAAYNRLAQLRDRVIDRRKWIDTPYGKRKFLINPLK